MTRSLNSDAVFVVVVVRTNNCNVFRNLDIRNIDNYDYYVHNLSFPEELCQLLAMGRQQGGLL